MNEVLRRRPRDYVLNVLVPANGAIEGNISIRTNGDFEWVWLIGSRTDPRVTVQVEDGSVGGGELLSNLPINIDNFIGTAALPFPLVEPYIMPKSSVLSFRFRDNGFAAPNTIQLVLRGYELY